MSTSLHRIALSLAVVACAIGGIDGAEAQRAPSKAPAKSAQATTDTDRALDGAGKALDAGNADAAMSALDGILSGGGLSNAHMARALYLRGLAHRKKGRPAQAIADLTSAIWLKDGLNEKDRTAALSARSEVTREVGIAAPASGGGDAAAAGPTLSSAPSGADERARVASSSRPVSSALSEAGFTRSFSTPSPAPAPETTPARSSVPAPSTGPATSSWESTTKIDAKGRERPSEPPQQVSAAPPPAPTPANPPPSSGGGLGSFITGLFTGGSPATKAPSGDAGGSAQWRPRTERVEAEKPAVSKAAEHKSARVARAQPSKDTTTIATSAVPSGAYRLQIATVRSRKEANAVATRVRSEYAGAIGSRQIEIDETVFGGMGTFYRVRLGPYANVNEPKVLCEQLRPKGYDCLVVTN
jgi:cell division septation protein DedD